MMADSMSYPLLNSAEIADIMQEFSDEERFTEADFKTPQANRIQLAYSILLECITECDISRFSQPQFTAMGEISANQDCTEGVVHVLHFALALQKVMTACLAPDFKIIDILQPKPKKTRRFLSALINFARFRECRWESFVVIKEEIAKVEEQNSDKMRRINDLKERINQIKTARAEEEDRVNQVEAEVVEESQKLETNLRDKEDMQKEISQIKTAISEKHARREQQKLSILTSQDCVDKLKTQVVQSPERMKADIARMQAALVSTEQTKGDKSQRLQELQAQNESAAVLMTSHEQKAALTEYFSQLLIQQKKALEQVEQVRDQVQAQKGVLTEAMHKEGHFSRLKESKQEKLSKLQLQHQHAVAAWQENIERDESDLGDWNHKNEEISEKMKGFQDQMMLLQREVDDKENMHDGDMTRMKELYNNLLQSIDSYHERLAKDWDANKPVDC